MKITQQAVDAKADESLKHAGQLKLRPVGDVEQVAIAYPSAKGSACGCATSSRRWSDGYHRRLAHAC